MENKIKLSDKQKEVITRLRNGWKAENKSIFRNGTEKAIGASTFESLVRYGVLYSRDTAWSTTHYNLTELGKTINID